MPFPVLEDLLDPGIQPTSPVLAGGFFTTEPPERPVFISSYFKKAPQGVLIGDLVWGSLN